MEIPVEPIVPGYKASIRLAYLNEAADKASLGEGVLVAQFRETLDSDTVLFTARSDAGTITVERGATETLVTVEIPAAGTADMTPDTSVTFDFIRIDGGAGEVVPGRWLWPVRKVVTRDVL